MITTETDWGQAPVAPPFERPTQPAGAAPVAESPAAVRQERQFPVREPFLSLSLIVSGATIGSMWALCAVVLAILGLIGVPPVYMFSVAGIALGAAFLTLAMVGMAWARMFRFAEHGNVWQRNIVAGGLAVVFVAGLAAIALDILSLVFLAPQVLGGVSIIVLGSALLWHSGVTRSIRRFSYDDIEGRRPKGLAAVNALSLAPVRDFLAGAASITLGILMLLAIVPMVLGFVAVFVLAGALTLTISTVCAATLSTLRGLCSKR
jgi:hypothetical protein